MTLLSSLRILAISLPNVAHDTLRPPYWRLHYQPGQGRSSRQCRYSARKPSAGVETAVTDEEKDGLIPDAERDYAALPSSVEHPAVVVMNPAGGHATLPPVYGH